MSEDKEALEGLKRLNNYEEILVKTNAGNFKMSGLVKTMRRY